MNRSRHVARATRHSPAEPKLPSEGWSRATRDHLSRERRSWNMSRIRGKNTTPEKVVRSLLHQLGYRFRLHARIPINTKPVGRPSSVAEPLRRVDKRTPVLRSGPATEGGQSAQKILLSASTGERKKVRCRKQVPPAQLSTKDSQPPQRRLVTPDIILIKQRVAIFIHGCFWHRHRGCKNCTTPTHRRAWWLKKLEGNAARDKVHQRALRKLGWRSMVIWECETEKPKKLGRLHAKLERTLSAAKERKDHKAGKNPDRRLRR